MLRIHPSFNTVQHLLPSNTRSYRSPFTRSTRTTEANVQSGHGHFAYLVVVTASNTLLDWVAVRSAKTNRTLNPSKPLIITAEMLIGLEVRAALRSNTSNLRISTAAVNTWVADHHSPLPLGHSGSVRSSIRRGPLLGVRDTDGCRQHVFNECVVDRAGHRDAV